MRVRGILIALSFIAAACADPGPARKNGFGRVLFYNGATSGAAGGTAATGVPANGIWAVTPDYVVMHLPTLILTSSEGAKEVDIGCAVPFQKTNGTLTKITDCPFITDTGTYTSMTLVFTADQELLINDSASGFYTTPTGVTLTAPAGGAKPLPYTVPQSANGTWTATFAFPTPVQLRQTASTSFSFVVNGLHSITVQVSGGQASLSGAPAHQRPSIVATVGETAFTGVEYYVQQQIGTAGAYCSSECASTIPAGVKSFALYYSNASTPIMASLDYNGPASNCSNLGPSVIDNTAKSYIGLDGSGNVSWAMPSGQDYASYVAEMSVQRVFALSGTTTLYCKNRSTDPAPAGGSYASGAPAINAPANSLGTFVLVAK